MRRHPERSRISGGAKSPACIASRCARDPSPRWWERGASGWRRHRCAVLWKARC